MSVSQLGNSSENLTVRQLSELELYDFISLLEKSAVMAGKTLGFSRKLEIQQKLETNPDLRRDALKALKDAEIVKKQDRQRIARNRAYEQWEG